MKGLCCVYEILQGVITLQFNPQYDYRSVNVIMDRRLSVALGSNESQRSPIFADVMLVSQEYSESIATSTKEEPCCTDSDGLAIGGVTEIGREKKAREEEEEERGMEREKVKMYKEMRG